MHAFEIAFHVRLDESVDQRRHRALIFAIFGQHHAGQRQRRVRIFLGHDFGDAALMRVVGVGMQEADADGANAVRRGNTVPPRARWPRRAGAIPCRENPAGRRPRGRIAAARYGPASPRNRNCHSPRGTDCRAISRICRKPAVTIRPSESISPCSSALVATVVPWARPATSSVVAPAAARISLTPRNKPIAGLAGVLATLVTCIAPDCVSTDTMSVNVPPVSMPMR